MTKSEKYKLKQNKILFDLDHDFSYDVTKALLTINSTISREFEGLGRFIVGVTDGRRDIYRQAGLYSLGRVWSYEHGWQKNEMGKKGRCVTNTLESYHVRGEAVDVAPFSLEKGRLYYPFWPDPRDKDAAVALIATKIFGLGWQKWPLRAGWHVVLPGKNLITPIGRRRCDDGR